MTFPDVAVGSIVAAMIGALVVFLSTIISKEQKTSEFRQVWIDEFRKDISEFISHGLAITVFTSSVANGSGSDKRGFLLQHEETVRKMAILQYRLVLRLNPIEHENLITEIRAYLPNLINELSTTEPLGNDVYGKITSDRLVKQVHKTLRHEWKRVKRGEPVFYWTKRFSLTSFFMILIFAIHHTYIK